MTDEEVAAELARLREDLARQDFRRDASREPTVAEPPIEDDLEELSPVELQLRDCRLQIQEGV